MKDSVLGFNGERLDPISGHYHLGNGYRAYNPVLMRFTCPDSWSPFGDGGINPYAYCAGDPVNRTDPSGHHSFWGWFGIAAGVALGALLTPISGGSSLAVALSVVSVTAAVVSTGLAVAQQFVEESDPKAAAALGWAALGTGILSGLSSGGLSKVAPEAKSLASLLKGTSNRPFGGLMITGDRGAPARSGLVGQVGFETPLYRADIRPPSDVLVNGFQRSKVFKGVQNMLSEADRKNTLIVSENIVGALRWKQSELGLNGDGYLYRINGNNASGVSLLRNFRDSPDGLTRHLLKRPSFMPLREGERITDELSLAEHSGGASELSEAHIRLNSVSSRDITHVAPEEYAQHLPLSPGRWQDYFFE